MTPTYNILLPQRDTSQPAPPAGELSYSCSIIVGSTGYGADIQYPSAAARYITARTARSGALIVGGTGYGAGMQAPAAGGRSSWGSGPARLAAGSV
jgi:hypothetical protein